MNTWQLINVLGKTLGILVSEVTPFKEVDSVVNLGRWLIKEPKNTIIPNRSARINNGSTIKGANL